MNETVMKMLSGKIPRKLPAKIRRDGEFFLAAPKKFFNVVVLNLTGGSVLELCDGRRTVGEIIEEMCRQYPAVERNCMAYDVVRCLRDLERKFLVRIP